MYATGCIITLHDVVGAYKKKGIFLSVKLQLKLFSSDSPFNILFIECRVLNPFGLCVIHEYSTNYILSWILY
jgi:hypothetical protein